jgi:hypothetical protein
MKTHAFQKAEVARMRRNYEIFLALLLGGSGASVGKLYNVSSSHARFQAEDFSRYMFNILTPDERAKMIGKRIYLTMRDFRRNVEFWEKKAREFATSIPSEEQVEARMPPHSPAYAEIMKHLPLLDARELTMLRSMARLRKVELTTKKG